MYTFMKKKKEGASDTGDTFSSLTKEARTFWDRSLRSLMKKGTDTI